MRLKQCINLRQGRRKMSLGIKQLIPDPWADIDKKYPVESTHKSKVETLPTLVFLLKWKKVLMV